MLLKSMHGDIKSKITRSIIDEHNSWYLLGVYIVVEVCMMKDPTLQVPHSGMQ